MAEELFFEGTEKLLEVWFSSTSIGPIDGKSNAIDVEGEVRIVGQDLRRISRTMWEDLLKLVHCEIISLKSDDDMDAYVLSESSMFVSNNRFILKTCGRTSLLYCVEPLLALVQNECGMEKVDDLFYSRKKYTRPELQPAVHQNFNAEVAHLDALFDNGAAYTLGRMNADCWYLYTIDKIGVLQPDQTLEVLMQDLDPDVMDIFSVENSHSADEACIKSGISQLIPDMIIDHFLFEPHGYSMNGILPKGKYITVHVTPEHHYSYVSFETNVEKESYRDLLTKVIELFKPGKFLITVFANKDSPAKNFYKELSRLDCFDSYSRCDHEFCQFKNYNLTFTSYARPAKSAPF